MKKLLLMIPALAALAACTAPDKATQVLEAQGFTEVRTTGYSPFACGKDDTFRTGFKAKSPSGREVEGTVCSGFLKGSTVRFD